MNTVSYIFTLTYT